MNEKDIKQGMLNLRGEHRDVNDNSSMMVETDDIIVEKCDIHHGSKNNNPLARMRFLMKEQLCERLTGPMKDLPEAVEIDESVYRGSAPRALRQGSIRIYSRDSDKNKVGLINHVFNQWVERMRSCTEVFATSSPLPEETEEGEELIFDGNVGFGSNILSQETDDEEDDDHQSNSEHNGEQSPIPAHRCDRNSSGLAFAAKYIH